MLTLKRFLFFVFSSSVGMDGLGPGVGWRGGKGLVWGVAFVEA